MSEIKLTGENKSVLVQKLQSYCSEEFDLELGQFDAEFFLDFIAKEFGAQFYNQGLYDAQAVLQSKLETITEAISEIEKVVY